MQTGRERARERVSKIPRKNPFDVRRCYVRHTTLLTGVLKTKTPKTPKTP